MAEPERGGEARAEVPRDAARASLILIAIVVAVGVVSYLGPILTPFLVGVFLYFATRAPAEALVRRGFPAWLAYLLLFVAVGGVAAALGLFTYGEAISLRNNWPRYQRRVLELLGRLTGEERKPLRDMVEVSSRQVFSFVFERGMGLLELMIWSLFYLLFIVLGMRRLTSRVHRAFPGDKAERILAVTRRISGSMEQFMKVKTLVSLGLGVSSAALLWAFGLDSWLLWGLLFYAGNYVTYIGSLAACVPPILLAFLDFDDPWKALALAVLLVVNRFAWVDYVEIRASGKHLNLDSVLLFLWLAYWGWMWGVLGLILAFPMITSLKIVLESIESTRPWGVLMSEE